MISYMEACDQLELAANARRPAYVSGSERLAIEDAVRRVAAESILSPEAIPPFESSSMDGFALVSARTQGATRERPIRFQVLGRIVAGDAPNPISVVELTGPNVAWEIMTGAPVPSGFDAIVKVEDAQVNRDASGSSLAFSIARPLSNGENLRGRGEDFAVGQTILAKGTRVMPEQVLALASVGVANLQVQRKPRVAVISTGSELAPHTESHLRPGMIRNSTAPHLLAAGPLFGADVRFYGAATDDPTTFRKLLQKARLDHPDVILTTGAVSKGCYDFIPEVLSAEGATLRFHHVSVRPGKPILFGEFPALSVGHPGPTVFGMPGNPVSTSIALRFFVSRYLGALQGLPAERPWIALLAEETRKPESLRCFLKARLRIVSGRAEVICLQGQPSFMVSSLLLANAWAVLPEGASSAPQGAAVEVYPLYPAAYHFGDQAFESPALSSKECC